MRPLQLARRITRGVWRRVRQPLTRRRAAVTTALVALVLAALAGSAHAAARGASHDAAPTWLFSKLFRAIGQLLIALGDWFASLGR